MGLCTVQASFKLPNSDAFCAGIPPDSHPLPKPLPFLSLRKNPVINIAGNMLSPPLIYVSPRAKISDETSGGPSQFVDEKAERPITVEDVKTTEKNAFSGSVASEETKEESPVDDLVRPFDFAEKLDNIKYAMWMFDDTSLSCYPSNLTIDGILRMSNENFGRSVEPERSPEQLYMDLPNPRFLNSQQL